MSTQGISPSGEFLRKWRTGEDYLPSSSSSPPSSSPEDSNSESPPHAFAVARETPLSHSLYFRAHYLSFLVRLASCLAISSGKATPYKSLCTHPRPCNMSTSGIKMQKSTQSCGNKPEPTHLVVGDPIPQGNRARARVSVYPESKDPLDPSINLRIHQLGREGAVGAVGPWIPPHCHLPSSKWLDVAANESVEEVHAHQPISEQTLQDVVDGLQLAGIFLSHPVPPAGLDGGALTCNHREWHSNVIPQEEPLFQPSNSRVGHQEVEVWVDS
jgi:hypothetical protein